MLVLSARLIAIAHRQYAIALGNTPRYMHAITACVSAVSISDIPDGRKNTS